ncbi:hypothetical protein Taro_017055 [Colocasia esculenta]|uniref:Uncharacterized protein n=1 Tax=Colocasia esculenta TaxID=4460 RepID=A0A843UQ73_COLES|nr:hypothetical protein [Colocasia esculenta]
MQSEVEEDHIFPSRSPLLQRSNLAAHDPNLCSSLLPGPIGLHWFLITTGKGQDDRIKLIISNKGTFSQSCVFVVLCQAPRVYTPAVNKYVGVLLPRTRHGPYCTGIGQMDQSSTLRRTNIFILWPQSFNDKLIVKGTWSFIESSVSTLDQVVSTLEAFPENI